MPNSYKILGQIAPNPNTMTNVYVTGASASAIVNTIYLTNQDSANANISLIIRPVNEALANKHYILQNQLLEQADTIILNLNFTMNSSVILAANNSYRDTKSCNVSINAFGVEIT